MKLYDWDFAPNCRRVRMFLLEKGIEISRLPHNYTAPLHEAQSSREQRLLVEQSGKRQHQRL
jgi:glutathione S-transferase